MSLTQEIEAQIEALEAKLVILNGVPEDTFNLGTVMVFAAGTGGSIKWYYAKSAEETWRKANSNEEKPLDEWILAAHESNIGYFEVYEMRAQEVPFYASA